MDHTEQKEKFQWLLGWVAFLIILLIFETGLLLNPFRKNKTEKVVAQHSYAVETPREPESPRSHSRPPARPSRSPRQAQAWDDTSSDPFATLERIQERMNRLFDTALVYGPPAAQHLFGEGSFDFNPAIDIQETDKSYVVTEDLPGLDKDKINISISGTTLTLEGLREEVKENKDEKSGFYSQERSYGSFSRVVELSGPVDETKVQAEYKNGVLKITLPKAASAPKSSQKVAIQ